MLFHALQGLARCWPYQDLPTANAAATPVQAATTLLHCLLALLCLSFNLILRLCFSALLLVF